MQNNLQKIHNLYLEAENVFSQNLHEIIIHLINELHSLVDEGLIQQVCDQDPKSQRIILRISDNTGSTVILGQMSGSQFQNHLNDYKHLNINLIPTLTDFNTHLCNLNRYISNHESKLPATGSFWYSAKKIPGIGRYPAQYLWSKLHLA